MRGRYLGIVQILDSITYIYMYTIKENSSGFERSNSYMMLLFNELNG